MGIHVKMTGMDMCSPDADIRIADANIQVPADMIKTGPRIGCESAGVCGTWPWRNYLRWEDCLELRRRNSHLVQNIHNL
jgi:hypothetical protein